MSLFENYDPSVRYAGCFYPAGTDELSYRATMVNRAIMNDDVPRVEEAISLGWIGPESKCLDNRTVIDFCLDRGLRKVVLMLRDLGWPEFQRVQS